MHLLAVVQVAMRGALQSSGQNCTGAERFYVHERIYPDFVAQIVTLVKSIAVGPPLSGRYDMGAICVQEHSETLENLVNDALDKGAEIVDASVFLTSAVLLSPQSLPFGGVKHSGFGRFAGVEGLRACCLVKSVVEDRWWPYIKTVIPKPIQVSHRKPCYRLKVLQSLLKNLTVLHFQQYPVAETAFEFQESLVEALYGLNVWDRLRALTSVVKIISERSPKPINVKKRE
ncbi:hypothetical protein GW17_00005633 [Ensete ventricosum]|nr:hypothetical protein GW17_00005633 [Ensete ventricosum]